MTSLVTAITSDADIPVGSVGIFTREQASPTPIRGQFNARVGIVGLFPWGPEDTPWNPPNAKAILDRHFPRLRSQSYDEVGGLPFGATRWVGVRASDAVAGSATFVEDGDAGQDSLIGTLRYAGALPSDTEISIQTIANGDDADDRDVRVRLTVGSTVYYDVTYEAVQAADGTVTDPGDPYVVFTKDADATDSCAVTAATNVTSDSDGTVNAALFAAGVALLTGSDSDVGPIVCVGVPTGEVSSLNALLKAVGDSTGAVGRTIVLNTEDDQTQAEVIASVASWRSERVRVPWRRVNRTIFYNYGGISEDRSKVVDGAAALACVLGRVDPWQPAMMQPAAQHLTSIIGLEPAGDVGGDPDTSALAALAAVGVCPFFRNHDGRYTVYNDVTSSLDATTLEPLKGETRRYNDYLIQSMSNALQQFAGQLFRVDLANLTLGPNARQAIGLLRSFLRAEELDDRLVGAVDQTTGATLLPWKVDPFGAATSEDLAAGRWTIAIQARHTPVLRQAVLLLTLGPSVQIQEL